MPRHRPFSFFTVLYEPLDAQKFHFWSGLPLQSHWMAVRPHSPPPPLMPRHRSEFQLRIWLEAAAPARSRARGRSAGQGHAGQEREPARHRGGFSKKTSHELFLSNRTNGDRA
ncbi:hypothetical protein Scinn_44220 [Streptomyces virginiae]|uniref:Uncharacterized protein n=1 Tax=Streptomyces virginiae TaxID=1961 RepID=A0ABQ3NQE1_STRVG|nr:hypothetical protein Scinn_44220 [Streptomyces virginiae]